MIEIKIELNDSNQRLDRFLKKFLREATLSFIYKAIRKDIKINGSRKKENYILKEGDSLLFYIDDKEFSKLRGEKKQIRAKRQFKIAYEDENLIVVSKPYGLLTHGDSTEKKNHLANQVIDYMIENGQYNPKLEKTFVPSPVNRLDRNTTGLVVFGKNAESLRELGRIFREREEVRKLYLTIAVGNLKEKLELRHSMIKDRRKNLVSALELSDEGKLMSTDVRPLLRRNGFTLAEAEIHTGRTHQIRVQMAAAGYNLVGDNKYGNVAANKKLKLRNDIASKGQLLHSYKLIFAVHEGPLAYLSNVELGYGKGTVYGEPDESFKEALRILMGINDDELHHIILKD